MPAPADRGGRLQLHREIARVGMGAVLKGRDADLGRDLAVKVLLDRHRDDPELLRRFVEEAQIGSQLEHPGIVPVYELGAFSDRRPYFTTARGSAGRAIPTCTPSTGPRRRPRRPDPGGPTGDRPGAKWRRSCDDMTPRR
jgi:hypothetical protein